jgi:hypothetical protein
MDELAEVLSPPPPFGKLQLGGRESFTPPNLGLPFPSKEGSRGNVMGNACRSRGSDPGARQGLTGHRATLKPGSGPVAQRIEQQTSNLRAEVRLLPGPSSLFKPNLP